MVTRPAVPPYSSTTIGDVLAGGLHLREQRVDPLGVGHEERRAHHLVDALGELDVRRLEVAADDVLEVGDADDVVEVLVDDRHAGEPAAQEQRHRLAQVLEALDVDDVAARHHHLADDGVAELEDRVDHLAFAGLDHRRRLGEVDQLAQLGLGRERPLAKTAARSDGVADHDQHPRDRAQHAGDPRDRSCRDQSDALGVLAADGSRGDAHDDEGHHRHHADGRGQ